jgi:hypothetical protein
MDAYKCPGAIVAISTGCGHLLPCSMLVHILASNRRGLRPVLSAPSATVRASRLATFPSWSFAFFEAVDPSTTTNFQSD